jgi:hypothetical protein
MSGSAAISAQAGAATAGAPGGHLFARAHERLMADHSLQFAFQSAQPPKVPEWLKPLAEFLRSLAPLLQWVLPLLQWIFWGGLALVIGMILYFIARELIRLRWPKAQKEKAEPAAQDWRPAPEQARALIEEADRLAAEGRFAEAVHLLLFRGIEDIERHRPRLVRPALTSRDILRLEGLPPAAKAAFSTIVGAVETSFFGGREIGAEAFAECRNAYRSFAFPEAWA